MNAQSDTQFTVTGLAQGNSQVDTNAGVNIVFDDAGALFIGLKRERAALPSSPFSHAPLSHKHHVIAISMSPPSSNQAGRRHHDRPDDAEPPPD
ncbi:hypothetical protein E4T56_gene17849, partial [Termitomyces sp. T112]